MKYTMMMAVVSKALDGMIKGEIPDKKVRKAIRQEYREILERASDIGSSNKLLSSYLLAAYFIGMNRSTNLSPEDNIRILEGGMRKSRALKLFMGDSKSYFSPKAMESRKTWSALTHDENHRKQYPNDWVVDFLPGEGKYAFGFDYLECGVCKLCRDEGCPELAKYLCRLDYMLVEIMGLHLDRTQVLAEGKEKCDFRFWK